MLHIELIPALSDNYIYWLHEPVSGKNAVVDPANADVVLAYMARHQLKLDYVLNTHHHSDHVGGNLALKQATGCQIIAAQADQHRIPGIDHALQEGDEWQFGAETLQIIATPGHTSGHIVFYCQTSAALFCGDTLFSLGCGRLFEGTALQLWQSLQRIKQLPAETRIYCAHEYTAANGRFALSVEADNPALQERMQQVSQLRQQDLPTLPSLLANELACNPFLRCHSEQIRLNLNLAQNAPEAEVFAELRRRKDCF